MKYPTQEELQELSPGERMRLLEDVWDTFVSASGSLPLSDEHAEEIDRRMELWQRDPTVGADWADVKKRITGR